MSNRWIPFDERIGNFLKDKNTRRRVIALTLQNKIEIEGLDMNLLKLIIAEMNRVSTDER